MLSDTYSAYEKRTRVIAVLQEIPRGLGPNYSGIDIITPCDIAGAVRDGCARFFCRPSLPFHPHGRNTV